jgi:hypothetical protein
MSITIDGTPVVSTTGFNISKVASNTSITPKASVHAARYTDEDIIEQILKVKASKEEILIALREYYPEKFI